MGQYFRIINVDKQQYIDPVKFGEGKKAFEFGQMTMFALTTLLTEEVGGYFDRPLSRASSWIGDRIVIAGDEVDEGEALALLTEEQIQRFARHVDGARYLAESGQEAPTLYIFAEYFFEDISEEVMCDMCGCSYVNDLIMQLVESETASLGEEYARRIRDWLT